VEDEEDGDGGAGVVNKLDGTDRGDGRVESVDERWRTMENDGDGERTAV